MFKTHYNFKYDKAIHTEKKSELPSDTVPDMSYSVREMLEKFTTGGMPDVKQLGEYDENATFSDALELDQDLVDVMIGRQKVTDLKEKLRDELAKAKNVKQQNYKKWLEAQELQKATKADQGETIRNSDKSSGTEESAAE